MPTIAPSRCHIAPKKEDILQSIQHYLCWTQPDQQTGSVCLVILWEFP